MCKLVRHSITLATSELLSCSQVKRRGERDDQEKRREEDATSIDCSAIRLARQDMDTESDAVNSLNARVSHEKLPVKLFHQKTLTHSTSELYRVQRDGEERRGEEKLE